MVNTSTQNVETRSHTVSSGKNVAESTTTGQAENEQNEATPLIGRLRARRSRPLPENTSCNSNQKHTFIPMVQCKLPLDRINDILSKIKKTDLSNVIEKSGSIESDLSVQTDSNSISHNINSDLVANIEDNVTNVESNCNTNFLNSQFRIMCLFCEKTFHNNILLQKHTERYHHISSSRRFSSRNIEQTPSLNFHPGCNYCSKNCSTQTATNLSVLFEHLLDEHAIKYFACRKCKIRFPTKEILISHNRGIHGINNDNTKEDLVSVQKYENIISNLSIEGRCVQPDPLNDDKSSKNPHVTLDITNDEKFKMFSSKLNTKGDENPNEENYKDKSDKAETRLQRKHLFSTEDKISQVNRKLIERSKINNDTVIDDSVGNSLVSMKKPDLNIVNSKKVNIDQNAVIVLDDINFDNKLFKSRSNLCLLSQVNIRSEEKDNQMLSRLGVVQNRSSRVRNVRRSRKTSVAESRTCTDTLRKEKIKVKNDIQDFVINKNKNDPNSKFDPDFYSNVGINVRENLIKHLDGKLGTQDESSIVPEVLDPKIKSTFAVIKEISLQPAEIHGSDVNLNAITIFPTLLTSDQYGSDKVPHYTYGGSVQTFKKIITKNSWKWKWDPIKKYKYCNEDGKIVRKIRPLQQNSPRDLSKLDIWTQLTMREKFDSFINDSQTGKYSELEMSRSERQKQINELSMIMNKRLFPNIEKECLKYGCSSNIEEELKCVNSRTDKVIKNEEDIAINMNIEEKCENGINQPNESDSCLLENLGLGRKVSNKILVMPPILSGEWARPRCYICCICGRRADCLKLLEAHQLSNHPNVHSTHYEIVGQDLLDTEVYKYLYLPGIKLNAEKPGKSNSKSETTSRQMKKLQRNALHVGRSNKLLRTTRSVKSLEKECTKCKKMLQPSEFYRHILECAGDYGWIMAKKKCKYKPFGTRRRRLKGLYKREVPQEDERIERTEFKEDKIVRPKLPSRPRTKPSDAETIQRMLANLPAKRASRKVQNIPPPKRKINSQNGKKSTKLVHQIHSVKETISRNLVTNKNIISVARNALCKKFDRITRSLLNTKTTDNNVTNKKMHRNSVEDPHLISDNDNSSLKECSIDENTNINQKKTTDKIEAYVDQTKGNNLNFFQSSGDTKDVVVDVEKRKTRQFVPKNDVDSVATEDPGTSNDSIKVGTIIKKRLRRKRVISSKLIKNNICKPHKISRSNTKELNLDDSNDHDTIVTSNDLYSGSNNSEFSNEPKNKKNKKKNSGFSLKWIGNKKVHFSKSKRTIQKRLQNETKSNNGSVTNVDSSQETEVMHTVDDKVVSNNDKVTEGNVDLNSEDLTNTELISESTKSVPSEVINIVKDIENVNMPDNLPAKDLNTDIHSNVVNSSNLVSFTDLSIRECSQQDFSVGNFSSNNDISNNDTCKDNNRRLQRNTQCKSNDTIKVNDNIVLNSDKYGPFLFSGEYSCNLVNSKEETVIEPIRDSKNAYYTLSDNIDKPPLHSTYAPQLPVVKHIYSTPNVFINQDQFSLYERQNMSVESYNKTDFGNAQSQKVFQKSNNKQVKNKKGLNDCIAMLIDKLVDKTSKFKEVFHSTPVVFNDSYHNSYDQPLDLSGRIPQPEDLSMKSTNTVKSVLEYPIPLISPSKCVTKTTPKHVYDPILRIPQFPLNQINQNNITASNKSISKSVSEAPRKTKCDFSIPSLLSSDSNNTSPNTVCNTSRNHKSSQNNSNISEVPVFPKPSDPVIKKPTTKEDCPVKIDKQVKQHFIADILSSDRPKATNVSFETYPIIKSNHLDNALIQTTHLIQEQKVFENDKNVCVKSQENVIFQTVDTDHFLIDPVTGMITERDESEVFDDSNSEIRIFETNQIYDSSSNKIISNKTHPKDKKKIDKLPMSAKNSYEDQSSVEKNSTNLRTAKIKSTGEKSKSKLSHFSKEKVNKQSKAIKNSDSIEDNISLEAAVPRVLHLNSNILPSNEKLDKLKSRDNSECEMGDSIQQLSANDSKIIRSQVDDNLYKNNDVLKTTKKRLTPKKVKVINTNIPEVPDKIDDKTTLIKKKPGRKHNKDNPIKLQNVLNASEKQETSICGNVLDEKEDCLNTKKKLKEINILEKPITPIGPIVNNHDTLKMKLITDKVSGDCNEKVIINESEFALTPINNCDIKNKKLSKCNKLLNLKSNLEIKEDSVLKGYSRKSKIKSKIKDIVDKKLLLSHIEDVNNDFSNSDISSAAVAPGDLSQVLLQKHDILDKISHYKIDDIIQNHSLLITNEESDDDICLAEMAKKKCDMTVNNLIDNSRENSEDFLRPLFKNDSEKLDVLQEKELLDKFPDSLQSISDSLDQNMKLDSDITTECEENTTNISIQYLAESKITTEKTQNIENELSEVIVTNNDLTNDKNEIMSTPRKKHKNKNNLKTKVVSNQKKQTALRKSRRLSSHSNEFNCDKIASINSVKLSENGHLIFKMQKDETISKTVLPESLCKTNSTEENEIFSSSSNVSSQNADVSNDEKVENIHSVSEEENNKLKDSIQNEILNEQLQSTSKKRRRKVPKIKTKNNSMKDEMKVYENKIVDKKNAANIENPLSESINQNTALMESKIRNENTSNFSNNSDLSITVPETKTFNDIPSLQISKPLHSGHELKTGIKLSSKSKAKHKKTLKKLLEVEENNAKLNAMVIEPINTTIKDDAGNDNIEKLHLKVVNINHNEMDVKDNIEEGDKHIESHKVKPKKSDRYRRLKSKIIKDLEKIQPDNEINNCDIRKEKPKNYDLRRSINEFVDNKNLDNTSTLESFSDNIDENLPLKEISKLYKKQNHSELDNTDVTTFNSKKFVDSERETNISMKTNEIDSNSSKILESCAADALSQVRNKMQRQKHSSESSSEDNALSTLVVKNKNEVRPVYLLNDVNSIQSSQIESNEYDLHKTLKKIRKNDVYLEKEKSITEQQNNVNCQNISFELDDNTKVDFKTLAIPNQDCESSSNTVHAYKKISNNKNLNKNYEKSTYESNVNIDSNKKRKRKKKLTERKSSKRLPAEKRNIILKLPNKLLGDVENSIQQKNAAQEEYVESNSITESIYESDKNNGDININIVLTSSKISMESSENDDLKIKSALKECNSHELIENHQIMEQDKNSSLELCNSEKKRPIKLKHRRKKNKRNENNLFLDSDVQGTIATDSSHSEEKQNSDEKCHVNNINSTDYNFIALGALELDVKKRRSSRNCSLESSCSDSTKPNLETQRNRKNLIMKNIDFPALPIKPICNENIPSIHTFVEDLKALPFSGKDGIQNNKLLLDETEVKIVDNEKLEEDNETPSEKIDTKRADSSLSEEGFEEPPNNNIYNSAFDLLSNNVYDIGQKKNKNRRRQTNNFETKVDHHFSKEKRKLKRKRYSKTSLQSFATVECLTNDENILLDNVQICDKKSNESIKNIYSNTNESEINEENVSKMHGVNIKYDTNLKKDLAVSHKSNVRSKHKKYDYRFNDHIIKNNACDVLLSTKGDINVYNYVEDDELIEQQTFFMRNTDSQVNNNNLKSRNSDKNIHTTENVSTNHIQNIDTQMQHVENSKNVENIEHNKFVRKRGNKKVKAKNSHVSKSVDSLNFSDVENIHNNSSYRIKESNFRLENYFSESNVNTQNNINMENVISEVPNDMNSSFKSEEHNKCDFEIKSTDNFINKKSNIHVSSDSEQFGNNDFLTSNVDESTIKDMEKDDYKNSNSTFCNNTVSVIINNKVNESIKPFANISVENVSMVDVQTNNELNDCCMITNIDSESLKQDKYLADFGMYTEKRPRKSTILANKKISQTFKLDTSDTEDVGDRTDNIHAQGSNRAQKKRMRKLENVQSFDQLLSNNYIETKPEIPSLTEKESEEPTNELLSEDNKAQQTTDMLDTDEQKIFDKSETYCSICKRKFRRPENLLKHKMTLMHISKLSEIEAQSQEHKNKSDDDKSLDTSDLQHVTENLDNVKDCLYSELILQKSTTETNCVRPYKNLAERKSFDNRIIPSASQNTLSIPSPGTYKTDSDIEKNASKMLSMQVSEETVLETSRKELSRDEALFFECCSLLKESEGTRKQVNDIEPFKAPQESFEGSENEKINSDGKNPIVTYNLTVKNILQASEIVPNSFLHKSCEKLEKDLDSIEIVSFEKSNLKDECIKIKGKFGMYSISKIDDDTLTSDKVCKSPALKVNDKHPNDTEINKDRFNSNECEITEPGKEIDTSPSTINDDLKNTTESNVYCLNSLIVRTNSNDFSDNNDSSVSNKDIASKKIIETASIDEISKHKSVNKKTNKNKHTKVTQSSDDEIYKNPQSNRYVHYKHSDMKLDTTTFNTQTIKEDLGKKKTSIFDITDVNPFDEFEDKFDKIKRKAREKAQAAQEAIAAAAPPILSSKHRKKSHPKYRKSTKPMSSTTKALKISSKNKRISKKKNHSTDALKFSNKKILTKGALKVFDSVKVSIPTQEINMNILSKPNLRELAEYALRDENTILGENSNSMKHDMISNTSRKSNSSKKEEKTVSIQKSSKRSHVLEYSNSMDNSCERDFDEQQSQLDVYEFLDEDDNDVTKSFKFHSPNSNYNEKNAYSINKKINHLSNSTINMEKSNLETNNEDSQISSLSFSDREDFNYMSDDYENRSEDETNISSNSVEYLNTVAKFKKSRLFKNKKVTKKSAIMGKIFKNNAIRNDQKLLNDNSIDLSEKDTTFCNKSHMDQIFDSLLEKNSSSNHKMSTGNEKLLCELSEATDYCSTQDDTLCTKISGSHKMMLNRSASESDISDIDETSVTPLRKNRKIIPRLKARSSDDEMSLNRNTLKEMCNSPLLDETGNSMLGDMYEDDIGVAGRKSQRKCTTGKQNVLVESWSSESDYEDFRQFEEYSSIPKAQRHHRRPRRSRRQRLAGERKASEEIQNMKPDYNSSNQSHFTTFNSPIDELSNKTMYRKDSSSYPIKDWTMTSEDMYEFKKKNDFDGERSHDDDMSEAKGSHSKAVIPTAKECSSSSSISQKIKRQMLSRRRVSFNNSNSAAKASRRRRKQPQKPFDYDDEFKPTRIAEPLTTQRRNKRSASEMLYYWSSSSDEEVPNVTADTSSREPEPIEQHGWIVGDSHKKLVTLLAHAKGRNDKTVKEKKTRLQN